MFFKHNKHVFKGGKLILEAHVANITSFGQQLLNYKTVFSWSNKPQALHPVPPGVYPYQSSLK